MEAQNKKVSLIPILATALVCFTLISCSKGGSIRSAEENIILGNSSFNPGETAPGVELSPQSSNSLLQESQNSSLASFSLFTRGNSDGGFIPGGNTGTGSSDGGTIVQPGTGGTSGTIPPSTTPPDSGSSSGSTGNVTTTPTTTLPLVSNPSDSGAPSSGTGSNSSGTSSGGTNIVQPGGTDSGTIPGGGTVSGNDNGSIPGSTTGNTGSTNNTDVPGGSGSAGSGSSSDTASNSTGGGSSSSDSGGSTGNSSPGSNNSGSTPSSNPSVPGGNDSGPLPNSDSSSSASNNNGSVTPPGGTSSSSNNDVTVPDSNGSSNSDANSGNTSNSGGTTSSSNNSGSTPSSDGTNGSSSSSNNTGGGSNTGSNGTSPNSNVGNNDEEPSCPCTACTPFHGTCQPNERKLIVNLGRICSIRRSRSTDLFFEEAKNPILAIEAIVPKGRIGLGELFRNLYSNHQVYQKWGVLSAENQNKERFLIASYELKGVSLYEKKYRKIQSFNLKELKRKLGRDWLKAAIVTSVCEDSDGDGSCFGAKKSEFLSVVPATFKANRIPKQIALDVWNGRGLTQGANEEACDKQYSPIVLDLTGEGIKLSGPEEGVQFDLNADGREIYTGWISGSNNAFLVRDNNRNGIIDDGSELFGSATRLKSGKRAPNGFEALKEFDSNLDGLLTQKDKEWPSLRLWFDRNFDGYSQRNELERLEKFRIQSMNLNYIELLEMDEFGNQTRERSTYIRKLNGKEQPLLFVDIWFRTLVDY